MPKESNLYFQSRLFLFLLVGLILAISCRQQTTTWQGTIEEMDGITIVKNPEAPMYSEGVCTLEEDLTIGDDKTEGEPAIVSIRDMRVDDEENIYVLDSKPLCIKVFDKTGTLTRKFGREGQGPGEWQRPWSFAIQANNRIIVNDWGNQRLTVFSDHGELIKEIPTDRYPTIARVHADSAGNVYCTAIPVIKDVNRHVVYMFDENLNLRSHYITGEEMRIPSAVGNVLNMEGPAFFETVTKEGLMICNYLSKYEFRIFNQNGSEIRRISKSYTPKTIDEDEKNRMIKERFQPFGGVPPGYIIKFPEHLNPVLFKFIASDEGMLMVGTSEKVEGGRYFHDIFDSKGRYITKIPLSFKPLVWKKGKIYFVETGEEGYQHIKRYKVSWNI